MSRVLFIPDRFTDHRMWGSISERLARRAEVSHLDELMHVPWAAGAGAVVGPARSLVPDGWDVVVAAGQAGPLAVALAAAGLARSIVLAEPQIPFDRIPDDVELDLPPLDDDVLTSYEPLVNAIQDADPEEWRALMIQLVRQTAPSGLPPAELELTVQIAADHAAEMRAELQAFAAADARDRDLPDELQWAQQRARGQWLDQLARLAVPVVTVVPRRGRFLAETVARIAANPETVLTDGTIQVGGAQEGARDQAAAAIEGLLDRIGRPPQG
jgi:hypothetical protein